MTIHAYVVNGDPQIRVSFPNGLTASVVVTGDGTAALAYWPTHDDTELDPRKFSEEERRARAAEVRLGSQRASAVEVMLFLTAVEAMSRELL